MGWSSDQSNLPNYQTFVSFQHPPHRHQGLPQIFRDLLKWHYQGSCWSEYSKMRQMFHHDMVGMKQMELSIQPSSCLPYIELKDQSQVDTPNFHRKITKTFLQGHLDKFCLLQSFN